MQYIIQFYYRYTHIQNLKLTLEKRRSITCQKIGTHVKIEEKFIYNFRSF